MVVTWAFSAVIAAHRAVGAYSCSAVRACRAIAAQPSSAAIRPVSRKVGWASSTPIRNLAVTGTSPAARTAAATRRRSNVRLTGSAAPPPTLVTLGTGHPKFRSTWSTPASPVSRRTASPSDRSSVP